MKAKRKVVLIVGGRTREMTPEAEAALDAEHWAEAQADRRHEAEVAAKAFAKANSVVVASAARTVPRNRGVRTGASSNASSSSAGSGDGDGQGDGEPPPASALASEVAR